MHLVQKQQIASGEETEDLVRRAQAGDVAAFERLVTQQYQFIFRTAHRWLGNRSDAEDVTQTVCMRLARILPGFNGRSSFTSWLYRVTLNAVRDLQRSQQRGRRNADHLAHALTEETLPEQEDGLRVGDIWRVVQQLPEKQRDAVLLVYGEEMSQAEAAKIMECTPVTVAWHIHKARKALKDLL